MEGQQTRVAARFFRGHFVECYVVSIGFFDDVCPLHQAKDRSGSVSQERNGFLSGKIVCDKS